MFFDSPHLTLTADLRHRELLAEAERFRLGHLARRAARRDAPRRPAPPEPPAAPDPPASPDPSALRGTPGERRCLMPR